METNLRSEPVLGEHQKGYEEWGVVIAWGHVGAVYDGEEFDRWCILTLLNPENRIPNVANYAIRYFYPDRIPANVLGRTEASADFPNIVPAVEAYCDWGMDY